MRRRIVHSASVLILAAAASASAQEQPKGVERVLIDRALGERVVQVVALDERSITYSDETGLVRTEATAEYVAIVPPLPPPTAEDRRVRVRPAEAASAGAVPGLLELVDGQRFVGEIRLSEAPEAAESVRWVHPMLPPMSLGFEDIRRIRFGNAGAAAVVDPQFDTVVFSNGDRLSGLIEAIGARLRMAVGAEGQQREFDLAVVREIVFANPARPKPPRGATVWLKDGSIVAAARLHTNRLGELLIEPAGAGVESTPTEAPEDAAHGGAAVLRLDDLLAAAFEPSLVTPLSFIAPSRQDPASGRRWAPPAVVRGGELAPLSAGDILLPGPMTVAWPLPVRAVRLAMEAELPRAMWTWGDCELIVSLAPGDGRGAERELQRIRLNAEQPRVRVSVALPDAGSVRSLSVRLDPGPSGAVEDRVLLRRPLLLIEPAP